MTFPYQYSSFSHPQDIQQLGSETRGHGDFLFPLIKRTSYCTGFVSPQQQQQLGNLKTTPEALETANLIFSGDRPWMADFF